MTGHIAAVVTCLGHELRARREARGLTRVQAVALMLQRTGVEIGDRTLLSYEHATRAITVDRLLELGETLGVPAPIMLAEAIRRAGLDPRCDTCGRE